MMWQKSTPAAFTPQHFPLEEDLAGRLQKDTKAPPFACLLLHGRFLTQSWKADVLLQILSSLS